MSIRYDPNHPTPRDRRGGNNPTPVTGRKLELPTARPARQTERSVQILTEASGPLFPPRRGGGGPLFPPRRGR